MSSIAELAAKLGLPAGGVIGYGPQIAKVPLAVARPIIGERPKGRLILVTGVTPTSHGEGKTVTTIGLAMALRRAGRRTVACLRQPSLGPVFGVKGGATGGGRATVEPAGEIDLGLTGDFDAIAAAHNLLSALVDNHIYHGNGLGIDPAAISWPRTLDVEDRALRRIVVNAGGSARTPEHPSRFVITAASEVMAVAGLARDYPDLKQRLGRILVGARTDGSPVRASDLRAEGAMTALLRRALEPNLLQSSDGTPVLVHGGPFGNIAHGTCSRISIELGLALAEFVVVEAGFATELGAEKFVDIACRTGGFEVACAVLVVTLRALRRQGGVPDAAAGVASIEAVERGLANLGQHLANLETLGLRGVVAVNRFPADGADELAALHRFCAERGVPCQVSDVFDRGAEGGAALADAVIVRAAEGSHMRRAYPDDASPPQALERLVTGFYGGRALEVQPEAAEELSRLARWGELGGPICVAKTPLSLSDDPRLVGGPSGFTATLRRVTRSAGAGFTVLHLGAIETMPGLPSRPIAENIDLDPEGRVVGLR